MEIGSIRIEKEETYVASLSASQYDISNYFKTCDKILYWYCTV